MSGYRDVIRWERDTSGEGDSLPSFTTCIRGIPCKITETRGDETYRGRQLEASSDYVVEMWHSYTLAGINSRDRVVVTAGLWCGKVLNIGHTHIVDVNKGRPPVLELYCRENVDG